ncbi:MAG: FtsH protease activity modulator HflK [Pseudomonadota bacterium]
MSWDDNGQSPWGRKPNNPWGGGQPPNFKNMFGSDGPKMPRMPTGLNRKMVISGIFVLIVLWLLTGFYRVNAEEQGVVLLFGKYIVTSPPGLHYNLPPPFVQVIKPQVTRVNRVDIGFRNFGERSSENLNKVREESLMLTGDENLIDIQFTVLWRISNARDYLFNMRNPEASVKAVAESAMREVIGRTDIQPALTEARDTIQNTVLERLQEILDEYGAGISITQVQLQQVDPPEEVVEAFNDVQRANQDRETFRNEAEAYRNQVIPQARAEAFQLRTEANAYKEKIVAEAQGEATRFSEVLSAYQLAPEVTRKRMYLETIEGVLKQTDNIILDKGVSEGVLPYLPLNELRTRPGS